MSGYQCPFCTQIMSVTHTTLRTHLTSFYYNNEQALHSDEGFRIYYYDCPNCLKRTVLAEGIGEATKGIFVSLYPASTAKMFPDYIPSPIREDYEEAYAIVNLSPKSSATLARRCLQGMIRDFWGITRNTLAKEIDELENLIPPTQWRVLNGLRRIGNIGAHMEKDINTIVDIEPEEAQKLLKLIEILFEQWYIQRHVQEQLYADIIELDENKQHQRSGTS